jgi:endonuclease/exonuclease/phosphatase (EEP) superfamily protein YafD
MVAAGLTHEAPAVTMNPYSACATGLLLLLTLTPLSRSKVWWVRALDFPRLQLFAITAAVLAIDLVLAFDGGRAAWLVPVAAAGCLLYHAWWITPYTRWFPLEVKTAAAAEAGETLRVLVSNVLMSNRNARSLLDLVHTHRPHVLVTLESDTWWQQQLDTLKADYPFTIACPLGNRYGMHVYARLPLEDSRVDFLVQDDVPSMQTGIRMPCGQLVRAHFVHPAPPSPTEQHASTPRDAELLTVARRVAGVASPVIVTGDLNDVAWSRTTRQFRRLSHLLDPRVGRGMYNTFHAGHWFLRWPLDHIFHSDHFTLRSIRRLPAIGSDHFPLLTELVLSPGRQAEQQALGEGGDAAPGHFTAGGRALSG